MYEQRPRTARNQVKSLARLAAEAAFTAPPGDAARAPVPVPVATPAVPATGPIQRVAAPLPGMHAANGPRPAPAVHVIRRRLAGPESEGAVEGASTHGLDLAPRPPRVHVLPGTAAPSAVAGPVASDTTAPRRRRQAAPPVTLIYRAEPQAPGPGDDTATAPSGLGAVAHLHALQAAIDADVQAAREAASFTVDTPTMDAEWLRLSADVERLAQELDDLSREPLVGEPL